MSGKPKQQLGLFLTFSVDIRKYYLQILSRTVSQWNIRSLWATVQKMILQKYANPCCRGFSASVKVGGASQCLVEEKFHNLKCLKKEAPVQECHLTVQIFGTAKTLKVSTEAYNTNTQCNSSWREWSINCCFISWIRTDLEQIKYQAALLRYMLFTVHLTEAQKMLILLHIH